MSAPVYTEKTYEQAVIAGGAGLEGASIFPAPEDWDPAEGKVTEYAQPAQLIMAAELAGRDRIANLQPPHFED